MDYLTMEPFLLGMWVVPCFSVLVVVVVVVAPLGWQKQTHLMKKRRNPVNRNLSLTITMCWIPVPSTENPMVIMIFLNLNSSASSLYCTAPTMRMVTPASRKITMKWRRETRPPQHSSPYLRQYS